MNTFCDSWDDNLYLEYIYFDTHNCYETKIDISVSKSKKKRRETIEDIKK